MTSEKVLELLVDVIEQPIQRPQDREKRKKSYYDKKK